MCHSTRSSFRTNSSCWSGIYVPYNTCSEIHCWCCDERAAVKRPPGQSHTLLQQQVGEPMEKMHYGPLFYNNQDQPICAVCNGLLHQMSGSICHTVRPRHRDSGRCCTGGHVVLGLQISSTVTRTGTLTQIFAALCEWLGMQKTGTTLLQSHNDGWVEHFNHIIQ